MKKSILTFFAGVIVMGLALVTTDVSAATSCPAGWYLSGKTCKVCPDGQISAKGDNVCRTCAAGQWAYNYTQCKACPAGSVCINGIKKACGNGYISGANASSCTICPEGQYEKSNTSCVACPAGSYCTKGIKKDCTNKQYCPANSTAPIACPANATCTGKTFTCKAGYEKEGNECVARCAITQYFNTTKKTCMVCEEGYYCADGKNRKKCADGYVSSSGKSVCTVCAEGKYEKDNKTCVGCPAGSYCTKGVKKNCTNKQYCPANSTAPIACPANATCDGKVFTCNKGYDKEGDQCVAHCDKGQWYNQNKCNPCTAGYYCADGRNRVKCATGYTSVAGKDVCTICPDGQYEKSNTSCVACPAGSYCTKGVKKDCTNKQYCPANSTAPIACPANATCNGKTFTCNKGYDKEGDACVEHCEVGQYFANNKCNPCTVGYYCADGRNRTACPKGTYNAQTGSKTATACLACDANKYTSTTGQKACSICSGSNQSVNSAHTGCENCKAGYKPNSGHTACELRCAEGQWWNSQTSKCENCSGNYYCPNRLTRTACPKGQVPTKDRTACEVKCEEGFFLNASKRCEECPAGFYCQDGKKTACPKGQYQNQMGQSACLACTGNKYTNTTGATKCAVCSTANYAVDANHTKCTACAIDKEANSGHTACVACSKVVYNGICAACKANYPKKKAYACTSKDKPICDTKTGSCVACTANFGAKSGVTCDEELPVCQKGTCVASSCPTGAVCSNGAITGCKEGYLMSSDKKSCVACPANGVCSGGAVTTMSSCISGFELSSDKRNCIAVHAGDWCKTNFTMEKGAKDFCPIATPICKNSHCTKCTSDSDCLFDIGNGLHHEGARCEANGTCTWAESIGCGDVNAEVNKQTLKCECKKGYVMQNGKCEFESPKCSGDFTSNALNSCSENKPICIEGECVDAAVREQQESCLFTGDSIEVDHNKRWVIYKHKIVCGGDTPICRASDGECYAEREPEKTCSKDQYAIGWATPNCVAPKGFMGTLDCGSAVPRCASCPANATCDGKSFICQNGYEKKDGKCELICSKNQYYQSGSRSSISDTALVSNGLAGSAIAGSSSASSDAGLVGSGLTGSAVAGSSSSSNIGFIGDGLVGTAIVAYGTYRTLASCEDCPANATCDGIDFTCKPGYVAKDGQCVLECNACQTLVNGSCQYKSSGMTTVCGEKCCSKSCNHNRTECCKNRSFGNKVEYKEGYRYSESTRYTVDSDSDMRLDISFVQIVGGYPRLSVCEVGGSCLYNGVLTSGKATSDSPGSILRNLTLKAGHTYDIDIDLYTKCGSCNMTAYCQGGSSNTKVCDASNLGQCQVCANNGVENKPDGSECHGDIGYCLKGQCVTCPNNAYYSSKEGTCICTNNMVMVDGQCVTKNCDEFPQIGDSCANSSCAYERLICQNGKWAPNCPDGYFYSYEGDTSFCVSNSKDCTGFELITGNRIIAADGARCGSNEQGVCLGGQCQTCPDGYHFEGGHFCVNPDVCVGVIDLITGERNRAEEGESCQSSNGEGICQNGKCVKKQCPDKFVLRDGQCVAECLGVLGYSCKKCNPETGDWDPVTAENIRSDWGAFGSCRDGQFYPNCPDASSLQPCYFCDEKTGSVSVASDGYKCNGGQGTCLQGKCLVESPVRVAEVPATCGDGTYLNAGVCEVCPAGSYCKNGERKLCKADTWNPRSGASSEDACVICAFGSQEGASTCGSMRRRS